MSRALDVSNQVGGAFCKKNATIHLKQFELFVARSKLRLLAGLLNFIICVVRNPL